MKLTWTTYYNEWRTWKMKRINQLVERSKQVRARARQVKLKWVRSDNE